MRSLVESEDSFTNSVNVLCWMRGIQKFLSKAKKYSSMTALFGFCEQVARHRKMRFRQGLVICVVGLLVGCTKQFNLEEGIKSFQTQDYRQAFIRLRPAAEQGSPEAQYAVGYMYYYGQGVIENRQKAWYWITAAAKNGNVDAQRAMKILEKNHGVLE